MRTRKGNPRVKQTKEKPHAQAIPCRPDDDACSKLTVLAAQKQAQKPGKNRKLPQAEKQGLGKIVHKMATQGTAESLQKTDFPKLRKKFGKIKNNKKCPKTEKCPKENWVKKNCRRQTFA